ncbi:MAG: RNA polymerase sigma factor [Gammaproteobacteria bacterium]|nr:RNA polymerase sigma factor [Gammaproteobacteria bacterium]
MQLNKTRNIESVSIKKAISTTTDIDIVKRVLAGNADAFEIIMRKYNQRLYRIARSILKDEHEAMDVVQEAYVKVYYHLDTFKGPDGFASWLSRIVSNEALMRLRKSHRINYTLDDPMHDDNDEPVFDVQPIDLIAADQLRGLLEKAIDQLPVGNRCVYMMRAVQQLSTRETAQSLDVTEEVVKTRYLRAKRLLQNIFEAHIEKTGLSLHEFDGNRCDSIVLTVMDRLKKN